MIEAPPDDEQAIRIAYWQVQPNEVVVDVGAHRGEYTLPALAAGARVYAIDAEVSGLTVQQGLTIIHAAIYNGKPYPRALMAEIQDSVHHALAPLTDRWLTLDDVVQQYGITRLDRLKVDVEGGELGVVQGASCVLDQLKPQVLIEDHTRIYPWVRDNGCAEKITTILKDQGYTVAHGPHGIRDFIVGTPCATTK